MINLEITFLGLALALDAAIVSFALGLCLRQQKLIHKFFHFLYVSVLFALFQGGTLWGGSVVGEYFTFSHFGPLFQYLVSIIFLVISFKLFADTLKEEVRQVHWGLLSTWILALATSLDSFAAGISLATLPQAYVSAFWVGLITLIVCIFFCLTSHFFEKIPEKWILRLGSLIFFILGSQIFVEKFF